MWQVTAGVTGFFILEVLFLILIIWFSNTIFSFFHFHFLTNNPSKDFQSKIILVENESEKKRKCMKTFMKVDM